MGNPEQQGRLYPVNDIFYSIQGEGYWAGTPAVFIRMAHCNLKCDFCDTEFKTYKNMRVSDILESLEKYPAEHIVLTGGEPLMQDLRDLCRVLKEKGCFIQIESNGMFPIQGAAIDWITCSPKNKNVVLEHVNELKLLLKEGEEIPQIDKPAADHYFISPLNPGHDGVAGSAAADAFDPAAAAWAYSRVLKNSKWRLSLQLHKILEVK